MQHQASRTCCSVGAGPAAAEVRVQLVVQARLEGRWRAGVEVGLHERVGRHVVELVEVHLVGREVPAGGARDVGELRVEQILLLVARPDRDERVVRAHVLLDTSSVAFVRIGSNTTAVSRRTCKETYTPTIKYRYSVLQILMEFEVMREKSPIVQQIAILVLIPCACVMNLYWFISFSTSTCSKRKESKKAK